MTTICRPSGNGTNYMYCNSEARSRGYDGQSHGIGFGGTTDLPRLFIAESFDGCIASAQDLTFEVGTLLPKTSEGALQRAFEIDAIEVWGVGGETVVAEALGARNRQREITAANIRKARKVDKAAFLDDFRSGLIESKAFQHREQMRGRADAQIDDCKKNAYVYEK
jgi:TLD